MIAEMKIKQKDDREMPATISNVYIMIGPPTSGKTSLAVDLSSEIEAQRITGRRISEEIDPERTIDLETSRSLMPDELFIPALEGVLSKCGSENIVFDNVPRTKPQARFILNWAKEKGIRLHLIVLELTEDAVIERASQRSICPSCSASYHPKLRPPKQLGICDVDNSLLESRKGDKPKILKAAFRSYQKLKDEILEVFGNEIDTHFISASGTTYQTAAEVTKEVAG